MSIEFGLGVDDGEGLDEPEAQLLPALVQAYRCPVGHLNDIVWTAAEMLIACEAGDVKFFCRRCKRARYASEAEASSLLAAFGLAPSLRIYAS
jgi:hypothetical protein